MENLKTYYPKVTEIKKEWWVIDAKDLVLGRLASQVAMILRGKHKTIFSPSVDSGDYVVIINAKHVVLTGKKTNLKEGKIYYRHTGFPGGIKSITAGKLLAGKYPERVVKMAVKRMISRNTLGTKQLKKLYVYPNKDHPHLAQNPQVLDLINKNAKNNNYGSTNKG